VRVDSVGDDRWSSRPSGVRTLRRPRWCSASAWPRSSALPRPGPG